VGLPVNFVRSVPRIRRIISNYEAHKNIGFPVDIDRFIADLKIDVKEEPFEDFFLEGYSAHGLAPRSRPRIYINRDKPETIRRKTKAHELHHTLFHPKELPLFSHIGQINKILEREANYAASYYLIPTYCINLAKEWGITYQELAKSMEVPIELVFKRYEIYTELKEHHNDKQLIRLPFCLETD
jgi:Zn-dependent peptidase ImmA (M78 family)